MTMNQRSVAFSLTAAMALVFCGGAFAFEVKQVFREERFTRGNVNLRPVQEIDKASWIWTDGAVFDEKSSFPVVRFRNRFVSDGSPLVFDVSADPRYVLLLDGQVISRGPHKGFLEHWYYQSYEVKDLTAGEHTLEAVVFFLGEKGPLAILSSGRGGFILKAEGAYDARLTTGKATWQAAKVPCMSYGELTDPDAMAGCENFVRGTGILDWPDLSWQPTFVVKGPVVDQEYGFHLRSWALFPTEREDEIERPCAPGSVKAAQMLYDETNVLYSAADVTRDWTTHFQGLLARGEAVEIPARTSVRFLWDLENYYCGFPVLETSGGADARIRWKWAEALYEPFKPSDAMGEIYLHKGNRDEFLGKEVVRAMADTFLPDGRSAASFTTPWWKCGRWVEIAVRTGDRPLTLTKLGLVESRYPLAVRSSFSCDDRSVDDVVRIAVRGMENCLHEMFMDCPYFEQQMYPGDTRVEMLTLNTLSGDDRLLRYGIGIFDYSRRHNGMIRMNFPSLDGQDSSTYSLCWTMMLGDYALWHGPNEFLRQRIPGLRQTLSQIDTYRNADGLLENLPGWSFEDWSEPWGWFGVAPDGRFGCSAVDNLLYVMALRQAAFAERACGDEAMGDYWQKKSEAVAAAIRAKFWSEERGLVADTLKKDRFSEHAQCLALLSDVYTGDEAARVFRGLVESTDLAPTTVYFSHYLFETYFKFGHPDLFLKRLDLWRDFVRDGLKTPMEAPGRRGRSDCHAWGAHPLYHLQTGIAGIRPAKTGYAAVTVAPQPGPLKFVKAVSPTPKGLVYLDLRFDDGKAFGTVVLPPGLSGEFVWNGERTPLRPGMNEFFDPTLAEKGIPRAAVPQTAQGLFHSWDPGPNWWALRHEAKIREAASHGGEIDLVFLGDSITHNWEGARGPGSAYGGKQLAAFREKYSVLCLGYGGDDTRNVLWRIENGELDGYRAKCVMLMVGTNNEGDAPEDTAKGIRRILDVIAEKQPGAKVLLVSIFPRGQTPDDKYRKLNERVNAIIRGFADGERVIWCDFGKRYLEPDGTITKETMPDFLHPRESGYAIWAEEVAPHFRRIIGR